MTQGELLLKLRAIIAALEQRQALIAQWLVNEDPELVLLGQYQQGVVNSHHALLIELMTEILKDGVRANSAAVPIHALPRPSAAL